MLMMKRILIGALASAWLVSCASPQQPEVDDADVATAIAQMLPTETAIPPAETISASPLPPTPTATPFPTHFCQPETLITEGHFLLARPIGPEGNQQVDLLYRYGHTVSGAFEPHRGVEFLNDTGIPVRAAADGVVVFAGWDSAEVVAEYLNFYGQVVVIQHRLPGIDQPVFTLYGHLSEILVNVGEAVTVGQEISRVGMTGIATGEHLHFEVRVGENIYTATRNPALWLAPLADSEGVQNGAVVGYLMDEAGVAWSIVSVVIESIDDAGLIFYPEGYQGDNVNPDDQWGEAFGIGELPPGDYQVSLVHGGVHQRPFTVESGKLTIVPICLEK